MSAPDELKRLLGQPLGRIPSGVYILTAEHSGIRGAMLASWVQQAAFDPPAISLALGKERAIIPLIRSSGRLALSILAQGDLALMRRYARGVALGPETFSGMRTLDTPGGVPVLADALAYLEGRLLECVDFGADHLLLVAQVTAGQILKEAEPFVHLRGSGFHY